MNKTRYRKRTQRTQALDSEYFTNCQEFDSLILSLETRGSKTRRQWKIDRRKAHSLKTRQAHSVKTAYATKGNTNGLQLAKNSKLDNKNFKVCQLNVNSLDYTPIYRNMGGTVENEFTERYKKDRYVLDKIQSKRSKN